MYIKKFRSMMDIDKSTIGSPSYLEDETSYYIYMYSIKMIVKGKQLDYKKIITSMSTFDMSNNHFEGEIPNSIGMLRALRNLNLSHNLLTGNIPPSIGNLSLLDGLDLSSNRLIGEIPQELVSLTFLEVFNVSYNQLEGPIPRGNNFDTFSSDSYEGNLELCGAPLLECKNNTVVQSLNNDNVEEKTELSMWEVVVIGFGSGTIVGLAWGYYILSVGKPIWLFKLLNKMEWALLDFHDHHFSRIRYNITNFKNSSICNLVYLEILDLSYNKFNGEVPHCLGNTSTQLAVLNLQSNNFKGTIPSTFSTCDLLQYVDFTDNQLEGAIPRSLSKCRNLTVLNLRNNKFKDVFPYWLGSLPSLEVLSLSFNKFHGDITKNLSIIATFPFSNLHILDISNNNFCGKLPFMYMKQFRSMMDDMSTIGSPRYLEYSRDGVYMFSIKMTVKGVELDYKKIITSMSTFDMSNNHFEGEIPNSIGMLRALRNLNLSHNLLTGNIPSSIGNLSLLDGLDLSSNRLIGEIPQELVSLTFLGFFNVSHNQLEGPIPRGNNFDTFSSNLYEGNLELCGAPLLECKNNTVLQSLNNDNVEEKTELSMWDVVVIGFGSGTIVGLAWGYYILLVGKPLWLFKLLNKMEWALLHFHDHHFSRRSRV
ncbi:receptor-like protein 33 [Amaranthus tricolor]|uniref:receptor-like protein 33 n=1 Tax=Amaranthus tricolor TaxID=29722 RepID=UPI00258F771B|nr:receptor-like protein 33 [Amaranthus tricolor]